MKTGKKRKRRKRELALQVLLTAPALMYFVLFADAKDAQQSKFHTKAPVKAAKLKEGKAVWKCNNPEHLNEKGEHVFVLGESRIGQDPLK